MASESGSFLASRVDDSMVSSENTNIFKGLKNRKKQFTEEIDY